MAKIKTDIEKLYNLVEERFLTLDEIERPIIADEIVRKRQLNKLVPIADLTK